MSRTRNAKRNIFWGVINKSLSIVLPFIIRTVMIYTMGMKYVGLGGLFTSILHVLSFAELGIGSALVFSMYKPVAENDSVHVSALLNLYRKIYRVIGLVILSIGLLLFPFLKYLVADEVPDGINLHYLFCIYLTNNTIGYFLFAYKQALFNASQRVDVISKTASLLHFFSSLIQIGILVTVKNYYYYVLVIPCITLIQNVTIGFLANKFFPQFKCVGKISKEELSSIKQKVGGMVFQKIGSIVLSSVDTLVISAFLGLTSLALFQNYYYPISAIFGVLLIIMQSIISTVGNSIAMESVEKNYADFKKFNFLYLWIVTWCSVCLLCLYQPFMEIWVHKEAMFGMEMVFLFVLYFFMHKWCDMLYVYQEACGIWWENRFIPLSAALLNLFLNIVLVKIIGLPGILLSTIVALLLIYDPGYAIVLFKTYFRSTHGLKSFILKQFIYLISAAIVALVTFFVCSLFHFSSPWIRLAINSFVCLFVPNLLLLLIWRCFPEFHDSVELIKRLVFKHV